MKKIIAYCLLFTGLAGCKEKYESPVHSPVTGYLVIEGAINYGPGTTTITLSRTTPLDNRSIQYENGAQVQVEGDDNTSYFLSENISGHYSADNLSLNSGNKYRLHIVTSAGKEYLSDFIAVNSNPPIDSISWKRENGGLQLYINTHDPQNSTHYYQWDYTETWEFHSAFASQLKYKVVDVPGAQIYSVIFKDTTDPLVYTCWQSEASSSILVGSSAKLSTDVIYLPLDFVPPASWKMSVLFSIDVRQYGLSKAGYEFLERIKKNTEGLGSIFDAQPSELNGNIHCISDPTETVVGYLNICPVREKRIFIASADVPNWGYDAGCFQVEIENQDDSIRTKGIGLYPTTVATSSPIKPIITYYASSPTCVDCTLRGTNIKPFFWP